MTLEVAQETFDGCFVIIEIIPFDLLYRIVGIHTVIYYFRIKYSNDNEVNYHSKLFNGTYIMNYHIKILCLTFAYSKKYRKTYQNHNQVHKTNLPKKYTANCKHSAVPNLRTNRT